MYSLDISESISCSMFGRVKQRTGWQTQTPRMIDKNLFIFMIDGSALFSLDDCCYEISAGNIFIIPAQTIYRAHTDTSCEYYFFHFSGKIKKNENPLCLPKMERNYSFHLSERKNNQIFFNLKTDNISVFKKIHSSIISCVKYKSGLFPTERLLLDAEFLKILLLIGINTEKSIFPLPLTLRKMMSYIQNNLTSKLSLSGICADCSVSAPYASRLFKQYLNITASEYINNEKLHYACELLQNTNMKINEISDYLGYNDVFYFSKLFKRKFGESPSKYFQE